MNQHLSVIDRTSAPTVPALIARAGEGPLFRSGIGRTGKLSERPMPRVDVWYMVRRRARDVGVNVAIGNHSFRAIGITDMKTAATSPLRSAWPGMPISNHTGLRPAQRRGEFQRN
jgi:hypothetical protein